MLRRPACARAAFATLLLAPTAAFAQTADVPELLPDQPPPLTRRYTGVMEREQPGYETSGIDLGAFTLSPSVKTAVFYDDNIFAEPTDAKGDGFMRYQPELVLATNWPRNEFKLDARGTFDRYFSLKSEDVSDYLVTGSALFDISDRTTLRAVARAESDHQSRLSEDVLVQTVKPLAYRVQTGALDLTHDLGKVQIDAVAEASRSRFSDGVTADGTPYVQRTSDSIDRFGQVKVTYTPTPAFGVFGQVVYDVRTFDYATADTPKRNSTGYQLLGGVVFEPAALMRGSIGIGYVRQNFQDPFYKDIAGLSFNARVSFFPTQLTTLTFAGDRSIKDSGIPAVGGYLSTTTSFEIDHELLRSLILSASIQYQRNTYSNLDRRDGQMTIKPSVMYRLNRWMECDASYQRIDQRSAGTQSYRPYVDNRLTISLTVRK